MALPTTGLTLHCDASDTDKLYTTYDSGGSHSGTPVDGSAVQVWDDEGDGIADVCMVYNTGSAGSEPNWRSASPLMALPCLDFSASLDMMISATQAGGSKPVSNLISASAFTVLIAFYAESITANNVNSYDNHGLLGDNGFFFGLFLKNSGGLMQVLGYNWDGSEDVVTLGLITENTSYVAMLRHESGNLYGSLNGGTESSVPSGNTSTLTSALFIGGAATGGTRYNGRVGEMAIYNTALTGSNLTDGISYFTAKWLGIGGGIVASKMLLGAGR